MNKGLYIHYPFCASKCLYCDFYSVPDLKRREEYEEGIVRAIENLKERNFSLDTVFFGGGTPTLMTEKGREKIFSAIRENFTLSENAEITVEANPVTLSDPDILEHFFALGVNRLSIGAQSFSDKELSALGRRHTASDVIKTVERARKCGFENLSLDLMMRIPHQTKDSFLESLALAASLPITHLSVYALSVEEHSVFGAMAKNGRDLFLESEEAEVQMYLEGSKLLGDRGFNHYEISNFARDGFESRHNLKYWNAEEYIGIGAAAHSYIDGMRFSSPRSIKAFCENPTLRENEEVIGEDEKKVEKVLLGLRLSKGISFNEIGIEETPEFRALEEKLLSNRLVQRENSRISLTSKGFFVSNSIISEILDSLNM